MSVILKLASPDFRRGSSRFARHDIDLYMQNQRIEEMAKKVTSCDKCKSCFVQVQPVLVNQIHDSYVYEFHCEYCVDERKEKV